MYRTNTTGRVVGFTNMYKPPVKNMTTTYTNQYRCPYDKNSYSVKWKHGNPYGHWYNNYGVVAKTSGTKAHLTASLDTPRNFVSPTMVNMATSVSNLDINVASPRNMKSFSYTGDVYTSGAASLSRSQDKEELQRLNDRFSQYIIKVRQLRQQSTQLDSTSFQQSIKILEEEVTNLKCLYERELDNIRRQFDEAVKEKNNLQQYCSKFQANAKELENRLLLETDKNRKLVDQMNSFQQRISVLEQELVQARMTPLPKDDMPRMRRDIENLSRENESLKQRLDKEQAMRREVEEQFLAFQKKVEFDQKVQAEQQAELRQRLETSNSTIFGLESKIRALGKTDTNVPELLKQVREAAEAELRKYQSESEQQHTKNMYQLKVQMETDSRIIDKLEKEKSQVFGGVADLKAMITSLEGQIKASESQKLSLEQLLQQERARFAAQLQSMEKRFREFQEVLFIKLKEANMSRESYIPLKAEIEALKVLLEEEERRLNSSITSFHQQTSYSSGSSPAITQTYVSSPQKLTSASYHTNRYNYQTAPNSSMYQTGSQCSYAPCVRRRTNQRR